MTLDWSMTIVIDEIRNALFPKHHSYNEIFLKINELISNLDFILEIIVTPFMGKVTRTQDNSS